MSETLYRLVCDYDGTADWSGANRQIDLSALSFEMSPFDRRGSVYERTDMPWDSTKVVGSREYRTRNQSLNLTLQLSGESDARLLEAWGIKFPESWTPSRKFDYIRYYDDSVTAYEGVNERPETTGGGFEWFDDTADRLYVGSQTQKFEGIDTWLEQNGIGGTYVWEYSDGDDSWAALTPVTNDDFTGNAAISWTAPGDWIKATMTDLSDDDLFYVRCRVSGAPSTKPIVNFIKRHRPITLYLMQSTDGGSTYDFWHRAITGDKYYPNGWCIAAVERILTPGAPTFYSARLTLVEANT